MKSLKCDLCEAMAEGETFEDWMNNLMPHYMAAHADVVNDKNKPEGAQEKWMIDNRARFGVA